MIDITQLSLVGVVALIFLPIFICASLLQAKGTTGMLAVLGMIAVTAILFLNFEGTKLAAGAVAAIAGLIAGGKVSEVRERRRMEREREEGKRRRDAQLRNL